MSISPPFKPPLPRHSQHAQPLQPTDCQCPLPTTTNTLFTIFSRELHTLGISVLPPKESSPWPPLEGFGTCRRVTNKGESGLLKANERVKAEDHRPQKIPVVVWWGAPSMEGGKLDRWKVITLSCSQLSPKRTDQESRPGPPRKPLSN